MTLTLSGSSLKSTDVLVNFRRCLPGEYTSQGECIACEKGTYNTQSDEKCKKCPTNAELCEGRSIVALPGFWAINKSSALIGCPMEVKSCKGGVQASNDSLQVDVDVLSVTDNSQCYEGYVGPLCAICK